MKSIAYSSGTLISLFRLEAFSPIGGLNERQIIGAMPNDTISHFT